jgi:HAD superfamily hydrolase (TIGR01509 family)
MPALSSYMERPRFDTLIMDLGDVLVGGSLQGANASALKKILKVSLRTPTWGKYERGQLSELECYNAVAEDLGSSTSAAQVGEAVSEARKSLQVNEDLIQVIRELKAENNLRVYIMSNIPKPDLAVVKAKSLNWGVIDGWYPSYAVGLHKPDLAFYRHVLEETNTDPLKAIFVDDKIQNVIVARSFGITGIVFKDSKSTARELRNLLGDPIKRGEQFLSAHAKQFESVCGDGTTFLDNFAQLLILHEIGNSDLVALQHHERTWNYFIGKPMGTTDTFPNDLDTTSIALLTLNVDSEVARSVLDEMLLYINSDGLVGVYFDKTRPRVDPVVCVNVLRLFSRYGRDLQLQKTLDWVTEVLVHRAYIDGTLFYYHAESFLFFLSCLFKENPRLQTRFREPLQERLRERTGQPGDALCLAMRAIACQTLGIVNVIDVQALLPLQSRDGGWEAGWVCRMGSSGVPVGNRGVTTALCIRAIRGVSASYYA